MNQQDRAARTLDPAIIMSVQQRQVEHALARDDGAAAEALETYLDLEERILIDIAAREVPEREADTNAILDQQVGMLTALTRPHSPSELRVLFEEHVVRTRSLFQDLWSHLDATEQRDVAAALEEARLSREGADVDLTPRLQR